MGAQVTPPNSNGSNSRDEIVVEIPLTEHLGDKKVADIKTEMATGGMRITISNLDYSVPNNANRKEQLYLLKGVNGYLKEGQMSALMGPSGSGKTTLLDVLAGRKTVGTRTGDVLFAGTAPTPQFLRRYTGYVEQQDTLITMLTVHEMLMYTAELKRPIKETTEEKKAAVDAVIDALALSSCRDTRIGNEMSRGISGGQAKRVNIGLSLVTNPKVLFLDEPTSGLDAYTANEVMGYVQGLTKQGLTICATIHSPTAYTFMLFDRLLLLLHGRVVYFGDNGDAATAYFQNPALPAVPDVPLVDNVAEWIVTLTTKADRLGLADEFADAYEAGALAATNRRDCEAMARSDVEVHPDMLAALAVKRATVTPSWWAFWTLFKYRTVKDFRNPEWLGPRILDKLIFSIVIFTLFWGVGDTNIPGEYLTVSALLFMWTILPAFGAAAYLPALVLERPLFTRERNDGLYRTIVYLVHKVSGELVLATIVSLLVSTWTWFAISLRGSWVIFWLGYLTTLSVGITLAYLLAAVAPNMDVANAALPTICVTWLFFANFFVPKDEMPAYWEWYTYLNPLRYGWGAVMHNQFDNCCTEPYLGADNILRYYSLDGINPWGWLAIEAIFIVVFFCLALLGLIVVKHQKR